MGWYPQCHWKDMNRSEWSEAKLSYELRNSMSEYLGRYRHTQLLIEFGWIFQLFGVVICTFTFASEFIYGNPAYVFLCLWIYVRKADVISLMNCFLDSRNIFPLEDLTFISFSVWKICHRIDCDADIWLHSFDFCDM